MKPLFSLFFGAWLLSASSCQAAPNRQLKSDAVTADSIPSVKKITVNRNEILKDFQSWYNYTYYNIRLAQDFTGLDADSNEISKHDFLNRLLTGKYVVFKILTKNEVPVYRLYSLQVENKDISDVIKQEAQQELANDKWEGKDLPDFSFTDIKGNVYNKANTKGKIIVMKCWFIRCVACVSEFPKLNELVNDYKQNKDVLFVSLARDAQPDLTAFLKTKKFVYAVVPEQTAYMNALGINTFPTHILVGTDGKIIKMTNDTDDLIPYVTKEINKAD